MSCWRDMLKHHFSWRQDQQAWQTRAVFDSSYIPMILSNSALCLRFISAGNAVTPQQQSCLQISLLEGLRRKLFFCAAVKQGGSPHPLTRRWHNVTIVWTWLFWRSIRALSLNMRAKPGSVFQGGYSGSQVLHCTSHISLLAFFLCFCKCMQATCLFPLPHVFVCMHGWGYRIYLHTPAWFP